MEVFFVRKLKKLVALGTVMMLFVSPVSALGEGQRGDVESQVVDSMMSVPAPMEQKELTKRDLEAIDYTKIILKDYFNYEPKNEDFIIDVYYSSDYSQEQYPKDNSMRDNISVNFMPKDENVIGGAYVSYYQDDKDVMSASVMNIDYEAKRIISKEKGLELSKNFLQEKAKVDLADFKYKSYDEADYNSDYMMADYYFQRVEQGIEVDFDFASASVDLSTGKVVSFYKNISKGIKFPSAEPKLDPNEALEIVKANFTAELRYMTAPNNEKRAIPVYLIDTFLGETVDAHTKQIYSMGGPVRIEKFNKTDEEIKALTKDVKPIDIKIENKGQAVEVANRLVKSFYSVELTPIVEDYGGEPNYIYVSYKDYKKKMEYYVSLNIGDNKNVYVSRMPMYEEGMEYDYDQTTQKAVISYNQAYDIAIKQLARIMTPEEIKLIDFGQQNYIYEPYQENQIEYYFNFPKKVNGIIFPEEFVDVRVNGITKEVESISLFWDNAKTFDSLDNIIKPEAANAKFLSDKTMELRYTMDYNETQKTGNAVIKLIYNMVPKNGEYKGNNIDAKTGNFIDYPMMN